MISLALDFLISSQDSSGGWGYCPGFNPTTEATATVILALRDQEIAIASVKNGLTWLLEAQNDDGGWGYVHGDNESGWQTAWAVLALSKIKTTSSDAAYRRGVEWVSSVKPLGHRGDDFSPTEQPVSIDEPTINSWPWYPGQAAWVEPTCLAILALEKELDNRAIAARIGHGFAFLEERHCSGGGWNVGNPVMFDSVLPGRALHTAMVLIAHQIIKPTGFNPQDIEIMRQDALDDGSPLVLAWTWLALSVLGLPVEGLDEQLFTMQDPNGSWSGNCMHTALSLIAARGAL